MHFGSLGQHRLSLLLVCLLSISEEQRIAPLRQGAPNRPRPRLRNDKMKKRKKMKQKPMTIGITFLLLVLVIYFSRSLQQQGRFTTENVSVHLSSYDEVVISNRHRKMTMENVKVIARYFGGESTYQRSLTIRPGETKSLLLFLFKGALIPDSEVSSVFVSSVYISANIGKNKWDDSFYFHSAPPPYHRR